MVVKAWHHRELQYGAVMSFDDIAEEMGITRQRAFELYKSAMKKLRRNPRVMNMFEDFI